MKESTEPFCISFQPIKNVQKWKKQESSTYTKKTILKNESEEEEEKVEDELLSGFDQSGALSLNPEKKAKKGLLMIPALKNKDWRQEILRHQEALSLLIKKESLERENEVSSETKKDAQTYGLMFINSKKEISLTQTEISAEQAETKSHDTENTVKVEATEDERAIEALLADVEGKKTDSNLILPMTVSNTNWKTNTRRLTEDELYRIDILSLPDPSTLEDYENVPVEEFGNALLRGMGWKEGEGIGKNKHVNTKPIKAVRRAQFLGIGAKEYDAHELDELGAWGKGITKQRVDKVYIPVLKINKATGKVIYETVTKNDSREIRQKNTHKKSPEKVRDNSAKKNSNHYSFEEYKDKRKHKDYDGNRYHSNHSIRKDSDEYEHHYSTNRHRNKDYNIHRNKH
ncbi:uncharacterized protein T551_00839 [Pneumocystis jirovecii RU7]|uniref:Pre-mRNA-splicing factor n=1 Tax=Pneumocystis jirovecii (strain RU7) TaxID=1408657 RepID=A0A0W4ZUV5_PNEJ7|nr:uncharacterized protein T551_00839 [Pneumocystis jirovecii RU7]KTW32157.1 hypothetical protein T551_00839 [Pneumocystis jirovecii RU7]